MNPGCARRAEFLLAALLIAPGAGFAQAGPAPVWRLSPAPLVALGEAGDLEFLRITSLQLRPNGSFLVANGDPPELRLFGPQGALQRTLGRAGSGPGEFRSIAWAAILGDSIVAYDLVQQRLVVFARDGTVLPSPPLPRFGSAVAVYGRLPCGSWLARPVRGIGRRDQEGVVRDTTSLLILSGGLDRIAHRLGPFLGPASVAVSQGQGRSTQMAVALAAFGAMPLWGVADSVIYTMDTATPELVLWGCDGSRRHAITVPLPERPIPADVMRRLKDEALKSAPNEIVRTVMEARYAPANLPRMLPRVRTIVAGPQGELWLEQYEGDPRSASTWLILDLRGRVLATVQSPEGFRLRAVASDRVAGVYTDPDGVESVRVYRLSRSP